MNNVHFIVGWLLAVFKLFSQIQIIEVLFVELPGWDKGGDSGGRMNLGSERRNIGRRGG